MNGIEANQAATLSQKQEQPRKWFYALQALRGLAFIIVYVSHSYQFFPYFGNWGATGVEIFILLSGFLNGWLFDPETVRRDGIVRSCKNQVWKKLKLFWPLHALFVLVACFSHWTGIKRFIANMLLVQAYFGSSGIALSFNWPTWTLSALMLSFLLSPLLNLAARKLAPDAKRGILLMAIVFAVQFLWAYYFRNYTTAYDTGYYHVYLFPLARMADFLQGILLSQVIKGLSRKKRRWNMTLVEALVCAASIVEFIVDTSIFTKTYRYGVIYVIPFCLIIGCFALEEGKISRFFAQSRFLLWVGSMSFELYIIHRMLIYHTSRYSTTMIAWLLCTALLFLLAIVAKEVRPYRIKLFGAVRDRIGNKLFHNAQVNK